jgi:hypothetical protein
MYADIGGIQAMYGGAVRFLLYRLEARQPS